MKKLLLLAFLPVWVLGQNTIGFPDITNYSKQSYIAGLQNWDIKQDKNGVMYFANNEGLLTYNGISWNLYPLPNKTIVRSVEIGIDNKIFVGGQDEMGYFLPDANGKLQYFSLTKLMLPKDRSFGDVWDIVSYQKSTFFRSSSKIFKLSNESFASYNANAEWTFLGISNGKLLAHDYKSGLLVFDNDSWAQVLSPNQLPISDPITAIIPINKDSSIITTLKHGIFLWANNIFHQLSSTNSGLFAEQRIYAATKVSNTWIALATTNAGIIIIDSKGNIVQSITKTLGLQNNNILSLFLDIQGNLWLGLDNGIDLVAYNSSIKQINPLLQDASGYAAIVQNNLLYLGTSNGLYSVPLEFNQTDLSFSKGIFSPVANAKGQVWNLSKVNNQLLLGNHDGAFFIQDNVAKAICSEAGYWNFLPLYSSFPSAVIIAGNYKGIGFFNANNQLIKEKDLPDFNESSRFMAIDKYENIWVSHPYHGIFKMTKNNRGSYATTSYSVNKGLPSSLNNHVFKVKNEVLFATEKGIYTYNAEKDIFEVSAYYQSILGSQSLRYLKEDAAGNVWFIHEKMLGVIDITKKETQVIYFPELKNKLLSGFEFIYPINEFNILVGGEKGFFHINYDKYRKTHPALSVQVREVHILDKTDSVLFGGYFNTFNDVQSDVNKNASAIHNHWKTIRIEFSAALYAYQSNLEYSFRLKGFDDNWSEWTKRTEKEYTNLPAGKYVFETKVRNNLGNESSITSYSFKVLPPWYQTIWAYIFYLIVFVIGNYVLFLLLKRKFRQQRANYEEKQKNQLYIYELERAKTDNELVALRNDKLESDINFKNSELASSAMHLLKKGELLAKIKTELSQIMKEIDNPHAISELRKLIRTLNEDDHLDDEWANFSNHFDKVHSDFLTLLKEIHPNVTANELKLSAYLRMNLSTKEIAQLMNISVRGVEISRYRLRKKLALASEVSLFDYLINIKTKD